MKQKILIILFFLCLTPMCAQFNSEAPWMKDLNIEARKTTNPVTFQEIVDAFNAYWETRDPNVKGSGYKPFKRWENHWQNYVKADGTLPTQLELWNAWEAQQTKMNQKNALVDLSNWQPVGPFSHTNTGSWSSGQGRINAFAVDPSTPTTYYAGAPAGGLWKSLDSGVTWQTNTDGLPQIGVSGIAVNHANPNIIYIATGDDDAGDSYSVGVMKSIDGGSTWQQTGLNPGNSPNSMNDIYMHPTNQNVLWVATNNGVYKTTDAGATWSNQNNSGQSNGTSSVNIRDIKIKPTDPNTVYAVSSTLLYKSTNGGESFNAIIGGGLPSFGTSRLVIDVTPANPNVIYVFAANLSNGFEGIYKSTNSGNSFANISVNIQSPAGIASIVESQQTWFDMAFAVSDTNENEIYTGVLNVWKGIVNPSNDTADFNRLNNWSAPFTSTYTHADIHLLRFFNGALFVGSDGGLYKSSNAGSSFSDLTSGMQISQFYRVAVSKRFSDRMVGGLQDNGGHAYSNNQWKNYYGADGMETAIDPSNSKIYYGFTQNGGGLYISNTSGNSLSSSVGIPFGEDGNWITPLVMNTDSELYSGYNRLYKLENNDWQPVSIDFNTNIDRIEIDEINPDNIFIAINQSLRKSTDRGVSFINVENFANSISSIEVNNSNNNIVYVTTRGTDGNVYRSIDGGQTFNSISGSLPAITKNIIKHQNLHSKNPLYLGTDLGVYRYDDDSQDWELFNNSLPNVTVTDLEINIFNDNITAATYGRGIWQSVIPVESVPNDIRLLNVDGIGEAIDCNSNLSPQILVENNGSNLVTSVEVTYVIDGISNVFNWTGNINQNQTANITIPPFSVSKGVHTFSVSATTTNDAFVINNDSDDLVIYINDIGATQTVNTFSTVQDELLIIDDGATTQYWERGIPTGTVLNDSSNPSNQVYGTNLSGNHADNIKSYLVSECYDLTPIENPEIKFDMAFQLELDWDIVYMEYSIDQGVSWNVLGDANDTNNPNWYNSDTLPGSNCFNCPGAQWTGDATSLIEYSYDLTPFTNESNMMFRFVFQADQSVNEEGVIVDNLIVTGNLLSVDEFNENSFSVYPNPSSNIFNIKSNANSLISFEVFDLTGKRILTKKNVNIENGYPLDLSPFDAGMYFINLKTNETLTTKKLILK